MDARFNRVFNILNDDFVLLDRLRDDFPLSRRRFLERFEYRGINMALLIRDAIERGIGRLQMQQEIRSDARHFLLINFAEMIAYPLSMDPEAKFGLEEIISDIESDTELVLTRARERRPREQEQENQISGGDVLQAVAQQYSELRVARFRVWN